jgi:hypothetical protein
LHFPRHFYSQVSPGTKYPLMYHQRQVAPLRIP